MILSLPSRDATMQAVRQDLILAWIAMDVPYREQARMLGIRPKTLGSHVFAIRRRVGLAGKGIASLVRYAVDRGLVDQEVALSSLTRLSRRPKSSA